MRMPKNAYANGRIAAVRNRRMFAALTAMVMIKNKPKHTEDSTIKAIGKYGCLVSRETYSPTSTKKTRTLPSARMIHHSGLTRRKPKGNPIAPAVNAGKIK